MLQKSVSPGLLDTVEKVDLTAFNCSVDFYVWALVSLLQYMKINETVEGAVSLIYFIYLF